MTRTNKDTLHLEIVFDVRRYPDHDCAELARAVLRDFNEERHRSGHGTTFKFGQEIELRLIAGMEYTYKLKAVVYEQRTV